MTVKAKVVSRAIRGLGVRAREERAVGLLALVFGLGEAGRGLGMNASDALFFLRYGVDRLPWMYMGLGALTFLAVLLYATGLSRFGWRFLHGLYTGVALLLVLGRFLIFFGIPAIYPVLWLSVQVISWVLVTAAWSLASQSFDTRQAKRLFSLFASASIFGGIIGHAVTGPLADTIGTENLFLVYALLLLLALLVVRRLTEGLPEQSSDDDKSGTLSDVMAGVRTLRHSRLLQLIVIASVIFSILYFSVWFPFNQIVTSFYPDEAALAGFLGNFTSIVMFSTLLLSLLSSRIYFRFGIVNVILMVTVIYLAGFSLWLVEFTLVTAVALRFTHMVWINGAGWTAWNALFSVYHAERREQLRAFESGVPSQVGTSLSGVLLLLGQQNLSTQQIFLLGILVSLVGIVVCWRMRSAYGQALLDAIRHGLVDVFTDSPGGLGRLRVDSQARQLMIDSLGNSDSNVRRISAELMGRMELKEIDPLVSALDDDSADVRQAAVDTLVSLSAKTTAHAIRPLLGDPAPNVRRAAVRALGSFNSTEEWLNEALADEVPMVRAEAAAVQITTADPESGKETLTTLLRSEDEDSSIAALRVAHDRNIKLPLDELEVLAANSSIRIRQLVMSALGQHKVERAEKLVLAGMEDKDRRVRSAAAAAAARLGIEAGRLFDLVEGGTLWVQQAALQALAVETETARESLIEWILEQIRELEALQNQQARLSTEVQQDPGPEVLFLEDLVERRQSACTDLVLQALMKLQSDEPLELVERGLAADDRELRPQALEALETLAEPRIVRRFIPLLEQDSEQEEAPHFGQVLESLSQNSDPWIRAIALRTRAKHLREELHHLQAEIEHDDSAIVHEALVDVAPQEGMRMTETLATLSTMERILHLRQIPIFEGLDPEDLHRIAEIADERTIPEGDYLCREGQLEDELYLIVEGQVSVTKEANGSQKELRRIGAGQPIGELAILASQPRSASVRAIGGKLKFLVIDGDAFESILRDRPEVSMAMLGNLARRLSTLV
ncbi:MAG: HEAT repeat domain-containing protein [Anaerolineales bacterium]